MDKEFSRTLFPLKKSKTSLFTICGITALFFLSTACENNSPPPSQKKYTVPNNSLSTIKGSVKEQLPLLNDDADEGDGLTSTTDEMSVIQFLNTQKQTQSKRIEILKNELDETKARLDHIKNDIMIKGSTKETQFNEKMEQLELRVKDSSARIAELESALDERTKALEEKRLELENLSKTFSKTNNNLGEELEKTKNILIRELQDTKATLQHEREEYEKERIEAATAATQLKEMTEALNQLQNDLENAHSRLDQTQMRNSELEASLEKTQQRYQLIMGEHGNMQARLEENIRQLDELSQMKERYEFIVADYTTLQARLEESTKQVEELSNNQQMLTKSKEILDGGLRSIITDLEGQLAENMRKTSELAHQNQNSKELAMNLDERSSSKIQQETADLKKRLADAEAYAKELEASLDQMSENGISALQIHQMNKEIEVHKESVIAAQRELMELLDDYAHLDGKYGSAQEEMARQIARLEAENKQLEKKLIAAEQNSGAKQGSSSLSNDEQYKRLNATIDHVTASLEREKAKRQALENQLIELQSKQAASTKAIPNIALAATIEEELQANLQDALTKYAESQQENKKLQQQLESTALWASNLQNEISAHETSTGNTATYYHKVNGTGDNSPAKLKAKIAYLTTRLAQEKDKAQEAMDKLEEARARLRDLQN